MFGSGVEGICIHISGARPVGFQAQDNKNLINNRQVGRRRGRGGQQQRSSGGNPGRQDTGNRIDNRARGNAAQLLEKYKTLARDAQMQGDRVNVEYYLQFADHYFRVLAETRARFEENGGAPSLRRIQGATLDEDEGEDEDEGDRGIDQPRGDQQRGGQNGQGHYGGQQNGYRQEPRGDGNRGDGNRRYNQPGRPQNGVSDHHNGGHGQDDRPQGRVNGNGEGAYARGGEERATRPPRGDERPGRTEPPVPRPGEPLVVEAVAEATMAVEPVTEPPRRGRGRPRREETVAREAGDDSGFTADRLPPSLNVSAVVADEAAEATEKPRRRRGRPPTRETDLPN